MPSSASTLHLASCAARRSTSCAKITGESWLSAKSASTRSSCRPKSRTCRCPTPMASRCLRSADYSLTSNCRRCGDVLTFSRTCSSTRRWRVPSSGRKDRCDLADLTLPDDGEPDEPLPRVSIQQFALGDGRLQFADLTRRVPLRASVHAGQFQARQLQDHAGRRRVWPDRQDAERRIARVARQVRARTTGLVVGRTGSHKPERARRARGGRRRTAIRHPTGRDEPAWDRTTSC